MVMKTYRKAGSYSAPVLREVKTSIESGFAISIGVGIEDYGEGNNDWL